MATTTIQPTTTLQWTTTQAPLMRGVTISHKLATRVTSVDLVPSVTFVVNPGLGECYEFLDVFINATYKPTSVMAALDKDFTDPAVVVASKITTYNDGWQYIRKLPKTLGGKVLIGKVLFVKIIFDSQALFYDLKITKVGYKEVAGG